MDLPLPLPPPRYEVNSLCTSGGRWGWLAGRIEFTLYHWGREGRGRGLSIPPPIQPFVQNNLEINIECKVHKVSLRYIKYIFIDRECGTTTVNNNHRIHLKRYHFRVGLHKLFGIFQLKILLGGN
jgi:hypothetical protein